MHIPRNTSAPSQRRGFWFIVRLCACLSTQVSSHGRMHQSDGPRIGNPMKIAASSIISVLLCLPAVAATEQNRVPLPVKVIAPSPDHAYCSVGDGHDCHISVSATAEAGWVACNVSYSPSQGGQASYDYPAQQADFLPGDPQTPARFKTFLVTGYAKSNCDGPGNTFCHNANVGINGFQMSEIPEASTPTERWDLGCRYGR